MKLGVFKEALAHVVLAQMRECRHPQNLRWCRLQPEAKHPLEYRQLTVDGCVLCLFLLPGVYVTSNQLTRDIQGPQAAKERQQMHPQPCFYVVYTLACVDAIFPH